MSTSAAAAPVVRVSTTLTAAAGGIARVSAPSAVHIGRIRVDATATSAEQTAYAATTLSDARAVIVDARFRGIRACVAAGRAVVVGAEYDFAIVVENAVAVARPRRMDALHHARTRDARERGARPVRGAPKSTRAAVLGIRHHVHVAREARARARRERCQARGRRAVGGEASLRLGGGGRGVGVRERRRLRREEPDAVVVRRAPGRPAHQQRGCGERDRERTRDRLEAES